MLIEAPIPLSLRCAQFGVHPWEGHGHGDHGDDHGHGHEEEAESSGTMGALADRGGA